MSYCPIIKWTLNLMKLMLFRRVSCRKNQFSSILEKRQSVYYMSKNRENRENAKIAIVSKILYFLVLQYSSITLNHQLFPIGEGKKNSGQKGIGTSWGPLQGSSRAQNNTKQVKMSNILLFSYSVLLLCYTDSKVVATMFGRRSTVE